MSRDLTAGHTVQERVAFWVSMGMLVCIGIAALVVALHSTGIPVSGWGLICSFEDADVVSCFRDWITSGAAVLTGVAIVFAVAQVREANRQSNAATRASLVHLKGELAAERHAAAVIVASSSDLANALLAMWSAREVEKEDKVYLSDELRRLKNIVSSLDRYMLHGVSAGGLVDGRKKLGEFTEALQASLDFACYLLDKGDTSSPNYRKLCEEMPKRQDMFEESLSEHVRELDHFLETATQKIAKLDSEVLSMSM